MLLLSGATCDSSRVARRAELALSAAARERIWHSSAALRAAGGSEHIKITAGAVKQALMYQQHSNIRFEEVNHHMLCNKQCIVT
jgi:hypothetical protein